MARLAIAAIVVLAGSSAARAQNYEVSWWTVDSGGTTLGIVGGTFNVASTAGQPDAGGPFAGGTYFLSSGFWAVAGSGSAVPQADLDITKTDGVSIVNPGAIVRYTIVASNAGPSAVTNATVSDVPPALLSNATWFCVPSAGSVCPPSGSGPINAGVDLLVGGAATFTLTAALPPGASGTLINSATITAPSGALDPNPANNVATDADSIVRITEGELAHGTVVRGSLATVGGTPDEDLYHMRWQPYSSYEIVLDEASGDISGPNGPVLEMVQANGTGFVQNSRPVGTGPARSLRFANGASNTVDHYLIAVRSSQCNTNCGADDVYRLRVWETTASVPRFNNAGQTTVLLLQNVTNEPVNAIIHAWSPGGSLLGSHGAVTVAPRSLLVFNTGTIAPNASGSLTIEHTGNYGGLAGKTVALEPATGFSFDSPLSYRPR
jgi:uncharacterized repeat protein (TIGR01451 family)